MGRDKNSYYMQHVLSLAEEVLAYDELPIAAIVVLDDEIIAQGTTCEKREKRFLGHAELVVLEIADRQELSHEQRTRTQLFTNLEPCMMCMGACMSFFLGELIYGLESPGDGAVDLVKSWVRAEGDIPGYQAPALIGGVLRKESIDLFSSYVLRHQPGPMRDWAETLSKLE